MGEHPHGATLLGIVAILGGLLHLVPSVLLLAGSVLGIFAGMYTTTGSAGAPASAAGVFQMGLGLIGVFGALLLLIAGFSVLRLTTWAWPLAVIAAFVTLAGAATRLLLMASYGYPGGAPARVYEPFGRGFTVVTEVITLVLCVIALVYLFLPDVRDAFSRDADTTASL